MKMMKLNRDSDTDEMIDYLRKRHSLYLQGNRVSEGQLRTLIDKLKSRLPTTSDSENNHLHSNKHKDDNSNKVAKPQSTGSVVNEHQKQNGHKQPTDSNKTEDYLGDLPDSNIDPKNFRETAWDEAKDLTKVDYATYDLNKLGNEELKWHKDRMEKLYERNAKKPGDDGFEYDVRVEYDDGDLDNSWDDDGF
eukprot:CAMPEP_0114988188 /NCGR_PEP_ID=MMETSP0216-20121206/9452_1 /TAXON_ID=223996 /ORGANISM="Protocruzia adherens, Strain Boccale" /LENGTH=191 /DNA_ID=CAMNT_0002350925 /DNA_START=237 /DNA_END=812 /DNA_ORIENTATION=+